MNGWRLKFNANHPKLGIEGHYKLTVVFPLPDPWGNSQIDKFEMYSKNTQSAHQQ